MLYPGSEGLGVQKILCMYIFLLLTFTLISMEYIDAALRSMKTTIKLEPPNPLHVAPPIFCFKETNFVI